MIRPRCAVLLCTLAGCGSSSRLETAATTFPNVHTGSLAIGDRTATLYVPGFSYDEKSAWFLILNDGQDAGAIGIVPTLADLWSKSQLAPMIVIALPAVDRLQQYGTVEQGATIACDNDGQSLGTRAAGYERYVTEQVLPAVERAVGFRPPAARTGIAGVSLGGLAAFSIAWDRPDVFAFAGVMSGSLWWRTNSASLADRQNTRIQQNIVARSSPHPGFRAFLEAGTNDETADRDGNGIIDAIDDTLWLMANMDGVGLVRDADYVYLRVEGGSHAYPTWAEVLPEMLRWAAPP